MKEKDHTTKVVGKPTPLKNRERFSEDEEDARLKEKYISIYKA